MIVTLWAMETTKSKTILLVDDDADYLFQIKTFLLSMGFAVVTAGSQREAEHILERIKPDLAILDLMMERHDAGFTLCNLIKTLYPGVPIIMASAVTSETGLMFDLTTQEGKEWMQADIFLDKSIRHDQLQREIFKLLKI